MVNKIILLGRLVKDPEVKYTTTGKVTALFTLAVDRPFNSQTVQKEADFIPIVVWGKSAEAVGNNLSKGKRALVEGRLQIRSYEDKNGNKRWVTEVIASSVQFIDYVTKGAAGAAQAKQAGFESFGQVVPDNEEIPF